MKKTIYYWSPFLTKVGTVKSTINSAISLAKYSKSYKVKILNVFGEWSNYKSILEPFFKKKSILNFSNKPLLKPGKKVKIYLDHFLKSKSAIVNGYFSMISLNNSKKFKAYIPTIKLTHPEILN